MTHLEREGVIRCFEAEWWLFYARSEQVFDGPFSSRRSAEARYHALKPVDRMLVAAAAPSANTDREFLHGQCNGNQFERQPDLGDFYKRQCERRGGTTKGRKYLSQLARFPGDPEAFVSGRGDVQKVLEQRGWGAEGSVKATRREPKEPKPAVGVADKIVDRETVRELEGQTVTKREYLDKREKVRNRIKPRWAK